MNTKMKDSQKKEKKGIKTSEGTQRGSLVGVRKSQLKKTPYFPLINDARFYRDIVATIREPLLVLDADLHVLFANQSFYNAFRVAASDTIGKHVYVLGNRQWDIPELRTLLEEIIPQKIQVKDYQVEHNFKAIGKRIMLLNARRIVTPSKKEQMILLVIEDITESRQAVKNLQETQNWLQTILNNAPITIFAIDDQGNFTISEGKKLEDVRLTAGENVGVSALDLYGLMHFTEYNGKTITGKEVYQRALAGETVKAVNELRGVYFDNRVGPMFDPNGKVVGVAGVATDVTERKQVEEKLMESEDHFRSLVENSLEGVLLTIPDGRILSANEAACRMFGRTKEEICQMGRNGIIDTNDPRLTPAIEERARNGKYYGELTGLRKDGTKFPIEVSSMIYKDHNGNPFTSMVIRDITARKQTEENLKISEARFHSLFENSPISLSIQDFSAAKKKLDGLKAKGIANIPGYLKSHPGFVAECAKLVRVIDVNQATLELYGVKRKEEIKDLSRNASADFLEDFSQELAAIAKGKTKYQSDARLRIRKDEIKWLLLSWSAMSGYESDLSRVLLLIVDITERKRAEQEIINLAKFPDENPNPVMRISDQGKILYANKNSALILRMWGKKTGQSIPRKYKDLALHSLQSKSNQEIEIQFGECIFSFIFAPMVESNYINLYGRDVTKSKQAEETIKENEKRYRNLFEDSPVSLWEEDFSAVKQRLDTLKAQGVTDMRTYLETQPQEVADCAALVKVLDVNRAGLDLFKAKKKGDLLGLLPKILSPQGLNDFREELLQIAEGKTSFHWEGLNQTLDGEPIHISMTFAVAPGHEGDLSKALLTITDITGRKQAEKEMFRLIQDLRNLSEVEKKNRLFAEALARNVISIRSTLNADEILDSIINNILNVVPSDAISIMLIEGDQARIVRSKGFQERGLAEWVGSARFDPKKLKTLEEIIRSRKYKITADTGKSRDWTTITETDWIKSNIIVPILDGDIVLGFVNMDSATPGTYTEEHARQLTAFTDQVSTALKNARMYEAVQRRMNRMQALNQIDQAINSSLDLNVSLEIVLINAREQLQADAIDILMTNDISQCLVFAAAKGFRTDEIRKTNLILGNGLPRQAVFDRTTVAIPDLKSAQDSYFSSYLLEKEGFISYYCAPLITKGALKGVMEVYFKRPFQADREWLEFLEMLAQQTAIAINNAELLNSLQKSNFDLLNAYETTLEGWVEALDMRDHETEGHTRRVTELGLNLAERMGLKVNEIMNFKRGALLHDIGKVAVPDAILNKPGPLSEEEWVIMRKHPLHAKTLLSKSKFLIPALDIPYCHHEKWDGSGYPRGLKGEEIPLPARIFAIVDVWDALTSDRPYRKAWTRAKALDHIKEESGKHFDPEVARVFLKHPPVADAPEE